MPRQTVCEAICDHAGARTCVDREQQPCCDEGDHRHNQHPQQHHQLPFQSNPLGSLDQLIAALNHSALPNQRWKQRLLSLQSQHNSGLGSCAVNT